jgi:tetratricopeptide (TPR) repeat protein
MLTNTLPFEANTPWAVISQHIASAPPTKPLEQANAPQVVIQLVLKALSKRPEDRFQSPKELLQAVESAVAGEELPQVRPPMASQADKVHELLLSSLYNRAGEATGAGQWTQAVNLYTQIQKYAPDYRDVGVRLTEVGQQKRLKALYTAAEQAIAAKRWQEAIDELSEIIEQDPEYRQASDLLVRATAALKDQQKEERLAALYRQGLRHLVVEEWQAAVDCLEKVCQEDEGYKDVGRRLREAKRGARKATFLFRRLASRWRGKSEAIGEEGENGPDQV